MRIAHISDSHIVDPIENNVLSYQRLNNLDICINDINNLSPLPDVVVHTGDITHNGHKKEFHLAFQKLKKLNVKYFLIPGNKDKSKNFLSFFNQKFNLLVKNNDYVIYSINEFDIKFVFFDTIDPSSNSGHLNEKKINLLREELNLYINSPVIIFMHHPPFDFILNNKNYNKFNEKSAILKLQEIFINYNNICNIFSGHIHRNVENLIEKITCKTVAPTALDLRFGNYPDHLLHSINYNIYDYNNNFELKTIEKWLKI